MVKPKEDTIEKLWQRYDADGSGTLSTSELRNIIRDYGTTRVNLCRAKMKEIIADQEKGKEDPDCTLKLASLTPHIEMFRIMSTRANTHAPEAFKALDGDGSGHVDKDEFLSKFPVVLAFFFKKAAGNTLNLVACQADL